MQDFSFALSPAFSPALAMTEVKALLQKEAAAVESWLSGCLRAACGETPPPLLLQAMEYSLLAGGKRIRPVLCVLSARLFGLEGAAVMPFAGAIECIHTYSLIHDDLPAMDDDDLRRGKPTCHKRFDEATAILAGDALLTDAFGFMLSVGGIPAERVLAAARAVALAAGSCGMVGGQSLDMRYTAKSGVSLEELARMHAMKTGALLRAPCVAGAVLAGAGAGDVEALGRYGAFLGTAFQIADDILDETGTPEQLGKAVGRDAALRKTTYPSLLGLEESRRMAREQAGKAADALALYAGEAAALLRGLAEYTVNRVS